MTILITGASGQLGHLVVESLLARGVAPETVLAGARDLAKVADLAERGVRTARVDYDDPATLETALTGVDSVLLISASEPGKRLAGHRNVIEAAAAAGIGKLVYTSAPRATTFDWALGAEHRATEQAIAASGIPAVVVRNNWYIENYLADVQRSADSGVIAASVGDGRIAPASRADFAEGAAVVLIEDGHLGEVYEFAGDDRIGYDDIAAAAAEVAGRDVTYLRLSTADHIAALESAGLDNGTAQFVAGIDTGIRDGVLDIDDRTLSRLIGRPTTSFVDGIRAALA
ncbi:SDR family oxidoreductase [Microbacterium sp. cf332]|uniref:SDR family oxidoreductase n=1 Tax=Microbacterium sp. cf332 TaxID=1761804 RepID=UPI0008849D62|nr:SDR family oxidoreductase [Microbacterium sp. cf332]SDQ22654.1 NAD(P)H dehydrogenase (quinone) [Microbacterium sp. cf332]